MHRTACVAGCTEERNTVFTRTLADSNLRQPTKKKVCHHKMYSSESKSPPKIKYLLGKNILLLISCT